MGDFVPNPALIQWVIQTCLDGHCPGEEVIVDHLVAQVALEAKAAGEPLREQFIQKLRTIVCEEIQITLADRFADRLRNLCTEEERELAVENERWQEVGF